MKPYKPVVYIFVTLVILGLCYKFFPSIIHPDSHSVVLTPQDTTFSKVTQNTYRPASIPFVEKKQPPPARLPNNVKPEDVKEVIQVVKNPNDTTRVIITNNGEVYVDRQNGAVESVTVTTYEPPILDFGYYVKLGIDGNADKVSPALGLGFCKVLGYVTLPVFTLDLQGMGVGMDCKVISPLSVGVIYHSAWNTDKSIRLTVMYNF